MSTQSPATILAATISAYLAYCRSLGRGYELEEWVLRGLCRYLAEKGVIDLSQQSFSDWRATFAHLHPNSRYTYESAVYNFCRYRRRTEPACFLPNPATFARRIPHALPILIELHQIARMLKLASALPPTFNSPLRPAVMRLALVLLFTTGMRVGELRRLTLGDIDPKGGTLHIKESKFHKSRWLPLSPSACSELRRYLQIRQAYSVDALPGAPLLCNRRRGWRPYSPTGLHQAIHALFDAAGVYNSEGRCPRVQDIRHNFAIQALLRWYQRDDDVQANLPKLAMYMGHVSIVSTAYYLRWMPPVIAQASERFERTYGQLIQENKL
jgi:integrase/recombinase XerD